MRMKLALIHIPSWVTMGFGIQNPIPWFLWDAQSFVFIDLGTSLCLQFFCSLNFLHRFLLKVAIHPFFHFHFFFGYFNCSHATQLDSLKLHDQPFLRWARQLRHGLLLKTKQTEKFNSHCPMGSSSNNFCCVDYPYLFTNDTCIIMI